MNVTGGCGRASGNGTAQPDVSPTTLDIKRLLAVARGCCLQVIQTIGIRENQIAQRGTATHTMQCRLMLQHIQHTQQRYGTVYMDRRTVQGGLPSMWYIQPPVQALGFLVDGVRISALVD